MGSDQLFLRGTSVDAARRFLLQRQAHPNWDRFLAERGPEPRRLMEQEIRPKGWYVVADYIDVLDVATRHLADGHGDELMTDLGGGVMDDGVTTLYKAFFAIVRPSFVIRVSSLFWRPFYKGSRLKVLGAGRRWVHGVVVDAPYCWLPLCHTIKGAMIAALRHAGAQSVHIDQHVCRSTGADRCDFRFSW